MAAFGAHTVAYVENRADHSYSWNVHYRISSDGHAVTVGLKVHLTGFDAGAAQEAVWLAASTPPGTNGPSSTTGPSSCRSTSAFAFVASGADQMVDVHAGAGRFDMTNWYQTPQGWADT